MDNKRKTVEDGVNKLRKIKAQMDGAFSPMKEVRLDALRQIWNKFSAVTLALLAIKDGFNDVSLSTVNKVFEDSGMYAHLHIGRYPDWSDATKCKFFTDLTAICAGSLDFLADEVDDPTIPRFCTMIGAQFNMKNLRNEIIAKFGEDGKVLLDLLDRLVGPEDTDDDDEGNKDTEN